MRLPAQLEGEQYQTRQERSHIFERIKGSVVSGSVPRILQGLYDLATLGNPELIKDTAEASQIRNQIYADDKLGASLDLQLVDELLAAEQSRDEPSIRRLITVAKILEEPYQFEPIKNYLDQLDKTYPPLQAITKKGITITRRGFLTDLAAAAVAGTVAREMGSRLISNDTASAAAAKPHQESAEPSLVKADETATIEPRPSPSSTIRPASTATPTNPPATKTEANPTRTPAKPATETPTATKTATASPTSTQTATPSPTATPNAEQRVEREVQQANIAEYLMGRMIERFRASRQERYQNDPAFRERVETEFVDSDSIQLVYLGIDDTRERPREFNDQGWGRSDVIILVSFNPHTMHTTSISFPRDLLAPELTRFRFSGGARINAATMTPLIDKNADSFEIMRQIIETASGLPVDGIIKTNIDFMQGYSNRDGSYTPGIFDALFPDGLTVNAPYDIVDNTYPTAGYGIKRVFFKKGQHTLKGRSIVEYARSRYADSDFARSDRQRQVLEAGVKTLVLNLLGDFKGNVISGNTQSLDRMIEFLKLQMQEKNVSIDFDLVEAITEMREGLTNANGALNRIKLIKLALNTRQILQTLVQNPKSLYTSYGISRTDGSAVNGPGEYVLMVGGSSTNTRPTRLGNYLNYWQPIRARIRQLVTS